MRDTRIFIADLVQACLLCAPVEVVAAGTSYATLKLTITERRRLTTHGISWQFD